jgi:Flp pilus assembly protein TadD
MISRVASALLLLTVAACASGPSDRELASQPAPKTQVASILAAAEATRAEGRFAEAMQIYQEILVSDAKSVAAQYGVAECLLALGKAVDAQPMFDALTHDAEFRALALQGEGLSLLVLNRREAAAAQLHEAIEADPKLWRAYNGLGLISDLKRQPQEAVDFYSKALVVNPESAVIFNNIGYSSLLAGKPGEAIGHFKKALDLEPGSETIQNNLRLAIATNGNYVEATRAVSRERMPAILNNVGYIAMQKGDIGAAEGYLARAMESSLSFNSVAAKNLEQLKAMKEGNP